MALGVRASGSRRRASDRTDDPGIACQPSGAAPGSGRAGQTVSAARAGLPKI